jgi:hypothetical protein
LERIELLELSVRKLISQLRETIATYGVEEGAGVEQLEELCQKIEQAVARLSSEVGSDADDVDDSDDCELSTRSAPAARIHYRFRRAAQ